MKVTQKKAENDVVILGVTASPDEVEEAYTAAKIAFAQQMQLQPDGEKTIDQVAQEKLGITNLDDVVQEQAKQYLIPFALDKKNIVPAYAPALVTNNALRRGANYLFDLEVHEKPDYELSSYDPVSITMPPFEMDDSLVEAQIADMADAYAQYVASDESRPVEKGDHVLLDIKASKDGEVMPGLTTDGRTYTTGEGFMPDGFDEAVLGMKVGETKSFTFTGPGLDDDMNQIEEVIDCTVTVKELQQKVIPAITDEWVKTYAPMYDSVEQMRSKLRGEMEAESKRGYENYKRQLATTELATRFEGKIEDPVYEAMQSTLINNLRMGLQQQGTTMDEYVSQVGGEQQFSMMMMMQTRQTLVESYALDALFRHEKMTLTNDDILEACAGMDPQNPQRVLERMEQAGCSFALRETAERLKASKWLADHAQVTIEEPK